MNDSRGKRTRWSNWEGPQGNQTTIKPKPEPPNYVEAISTLHLQVGSGLQFQQPRVLRPLPPSPEHSATNDAAADVIFVTEDDSQDVPPRRQQTLQGLWNTDTHLFLWARTRRCLESYQKTSLTVVHPAILDELNTAWYLSSDESSQEHSPLSLNITIAICLGAAAVGEAKVEQEFWMRARDALGSLFDESDFYVAVALLKMCDYAAHKGNYEQALYYATLGSQICEQLDRLNNATYLWLLVPLYLGYDPKPEIFWAKLHQAKQSPRLLKPDELDDRSSSTLGKPRERVDESMIHLDTIFLELCMQLGRIHTAVSTNMTDVALLLDNKDRLNELNQQWQKVRHVFSPTQRLEMDIMMPSNFSMIFYGLGDQEAALSAACEFLALAEESSLFPFIPMLPCGAKYPLKALLETGNLYSLQRLVAILQPLNQGTFLDDQLEEFKRWYFENVRQVT